MISVNPVTPEKQTNVHEQHKQHNLSPKTRYDHHNHQHLPNVAKSHFYFSSYQINCLTEYKVSN